MKKQVGVDIYDVMEAVFHLDTFILFFTCRNVQLIWRDEADSPWTCFRVEYMCMFFFFGWLPGFDVMEADSSWRGKIDRIVESPSAVEIKIDG